MDQLKAFEAFACLRGYNATVIDDFIIIIDVQNPGNDFKVMRISDQYAVFTMRISRADHEYAAKCMIYVLLAEHNRDNAASTHNHINFKVDL